MLEFSSPLMNNSYSLINLCELPFVSEVLLFYIPNVVLSVQYV